MSKYPWADNQQKLQRAIERANIEQQPAGKREERIKQLYVSYGGKVVELPEIKENKNMNEDENKVPSDEGDVKEGEDHAGSEGADNAPGTEGEGADVGEGAAA